MPIKLTPYKVWTWSRSDDVALKYTIQRGEKDSPVATFEISNSYLRDEQKQRAAEYCGYMNKIIEATEEAYSQNQLADILKR